MSTTSLNELKETPEDEPCSGPGPKAIMAFMLVQEKWTLRIIHAVLPGPIGFNQMKRAVGGVNSTTLAQRLVLLEQAGLLHKTVHSTMPPRTSYELTEAGHALEPILHAIAEWGERYLPDPPAEWADGAGDCHGDELAAEFPTLDLSDVALEDS